MYSASPQTQEPHSARGIISVSCVVSCAGPGVNNLVPVEGVTSVIDAGRCGRGVHRFFSEEALLT